MTTLPGSASDHSRTWLQHALLPSVVRRACLYAVVVGAILITINHGDALMRGEFTCGRAIKMLLTVCVPYVVSTLSSVGALRSRGSAGGVDVRQGP
jgi:hypothetical protein